MFCCLTICSRKDSVCLLKLDSFTSSRSLILSGQNSSKLLQTTLWRCTHTHTQQQQTLFRVRSASKFSASSFSNRESSARTWFEFNLCTGDIKVIHNFSCSFVRFASMTFFSIVLCSLSLSFRFASSDFELICSTSRNWPTICYRAKEWERYGNESGIKNCSAFKFLFRWRGAV